MSSENSNKKEKFYWFGAFSSIKFRMILEKIRKLKDRCREKSTIKVQNPEIKISKDEITSKEFFVSDFNKDQIKEESKIVDSQVKKIKPPTFIARESPKRLKYDESSFFENIVKLSTESKENISDNNFENLINLAAKEKIIKHSFEEDYVLQSKNMINKGALSINEVKDDPNSIKNNDSIIIVKNEHLISMKEDSINTDPKNVESNIFFKSQENSNNSVKEEKSIDSLKEDKSIDSLKEDKSIQTSKEIIQDSNLLEKNIPKIYNYDEIPRLDFSENSDKTQLISLCKEILNDIFSLKEKSKIINQNLCSGFEESDRKNNDQERIKFEMERMGEFYLAFSKKLIEECAISLENFKENSIGVLNLINNIFDQIEQIRNKIQKLKESQKSKNLRILRLENDILQMNNQAISLASTINAQKIIIDDFKMETCDFNNRFNELKQKNIDLQNDLSMKDGDLADMKLAEIDMKSQIRINLEDINFLKKQNVAFSEENNILKNQNCLLKNQIFDLFKKSQILFPGFNQIRTFFEIIRRNYLRLFNLVEIDVSSQRNALKELKNKFSEIENLFLQKQIHSEKTFGDEISSLNKNILELEESKRLFEIEKNNFNAEISKLKIRNDELQEEIELKAKYISDLEKNASDFQNSTDFYQKQLVAADLVIQELKNNKITIDASMEISRIRKKHLKEISALKLRIEELELDQK